MSKGRVTIPTDAKFVEGTKRMMEEWGADALRDCDGTSLPENVAELAPKVYKTYFLSRGDNEWIAAHPQYLQNIALSTPLVLSEGGDLSIRPMEEYYPEQVALNDREESLARWQVIDLTTGKEHKDWEYHRDTQTVIVKNTVAMHEYSVYFFALDLWDFVQIYNYTTNGWTCPKDVDMDPIYPEVRARMKENLIRWLEANPSVTLVRLTTFFYNFMAIHRKDYKHTMHFDWYSYAFTASPEMFSLFQEEMGYEIQLSDIIDDRYYANNFRVPTKRYLDYMDFVQRKVCGFAKEFVDIIHSYGKEAMMFWGDNWIGAEPYGKYFSSIGLDAIVGSTNSAWTTRLLSQVDTVKYTEARMLPYFFPDTLNDDEEGTRFFLENWLSTRRALMRVPVARIGFGGYLELACKFPKFVKTAAKACEDFRSIHEVLAGQKPFSIAKVAVLTAWGRIRSWMMDSICLDGSHQRVEGTQGVYEMLAGMPIEVEFISFEDVLEGKLNQYDILMNMGVAGNACSGGEKWNNPEVVTKIAEFVHNGGGLIGMGEPSAYMAHGKYFQLAHVLGVEREQSATMFTNKFNYKKIDGHFITADVSKPIDYGTPVSNIYCLEGAKILDVIPNSRWGIDMNKGHVTLACNEFGAGRSVYINQLKNNPENNRLLLRSLLWAAHKEEFVTRCFSTNMATEAHYYPGSGKLVVINNSETEQKTTVFGFDGRQSEHTIEPCGMIVIEK